MHDPYLGPVLLFGVGLVAGALNAIAGGGSFLTLPLMIFLGLPATVANGTNRLAVITSGAGAAWSFHRRGLVDAPTLRLAIPPSLVGAVLGTWVGVEIGDLAFQRLLAAAMVTLTAWTLWHPSGRKAEDGGPRLPASGGRKALFASVYLLVGFYGGLVQAGVGFLILAATTAAGLDLIRGNAVKAALVLAFTPVTLALFAAGGRVDWPMAVWLAAGNYLGALAGVRLQVLKGQAWVRNVVTATIVVFAVRLLVVR